MIERDKNQQAASESWLARLNSQAGAEKSVRFLRCCIWDGLWSRCLLLPGDRSNTTALNTPSTPQRLSDDAVLGPCLFLAAHRMHFAHPRRVGSVKLGQSGMQGLADFWGRNPSVCECICGDAVANCCGAGPL